MIFNVVFGHINLLPSFKIGKTYSFPIQNIYNHRFGGSIKFIFILSPLKIYRVVIVLFGLPVQFLPYHTIQSYHECWLLPSSDISSVAYGTHDDLILYARSCNTPLSNNCRECCVKCECDESIKLEIINCHIKIKNTTELTSRVTFLHITTWRYKFIQDVKLLHDVKLMHAVFIGFTKV